MLDDRHCQDYLIEFSDYIDGELTPELCAQIESHLQNCENCRIVVNTLRKTIELYQIHGEDESLPENVRMRLFARLELEDPSHG